MPDKNLRHKRPNNKKKIRVQIPAQFLLFKMSNFVIPCLIVLNINQISSEYILYTCASNSAYSWFVDKRFSTSFISLSDSTRGFRV